MERKQIELEVDHILDSGANTLRFAELIEFIIKKEQRIAVEKHSKKVTQTLRKHGVSKDAPILNILTSLTDKVINKLNK